MEIKDRIKQLMESLHTTQKVFAQTTGISEASLSGVFNGRTKPSINMIEAIHGRFPDVSVEWLMFGTGEMKAGQQASSSDDAQDSTMAGGVLGDVSTDGTSDNMGTDGSPTLFSGLGGNVQSRNTAAVQSAPATRQHVIKYVEKAPRKITEIRIFYDDQTWETFVPKE